MVTQLVPSTPPANRRCSSGSVATLAASSLIPPKAPQVTKTPTARNAISLTTDSNAIARIMPSWCSVASIWRVPNRIANRARIRDAISAVSLHGGRLAVGEGMTMAGYWSSTRKLVETAFSWRAM